MRVGSSSPGGQNFTDDDGLIHRAHVAGNCARLVVGRKALAVLLLGRCDDRHIQIWLEVGEMSGPVVWESQQIGCLQRIRGRPDGAAMPLVVDASVRCSDAAKSLASSSVKVITRYYARAVQKLRRKDPNCRRAKAIFATGLAMPCALNTSIGESRASRSLLPSYGGFCFTQRRSARIRMA